MPIQADSKNMEASKTVDSELLEFRLNTEFYIVIQYRSSISSENIKKPIRLKP